jgi:hypothetical protein
MPMLRRDFLKTATATAVLERFSSREGYDAWLKAVLAARVIFGL